jgi:hypothetical protein
MHLNVHYSTTFFVSRAFHDCSHTITPEEQTMINFARVQEYLNLVVAKAGDNAANAPHKQFWSSYQTLTTQPLPVVRCQGAPISAIKWLDEAKTQVDADNSPLYVILTNANGFCNKDQMPPGGPFVLDDGYSVVLADGTTVTGAQIAADIHDWLLGGAHEFSTSPST